MDRADAGGDPYGTNPPSAGNDLAPVGESGIEPDGLMMTTALPRSASREPTASGEAGDDPGDPGTDRGDADAVEPDAVEPDDVGGLADATAVSGDATAAPGGRADPRKRAGSAAGAMIGVLLLVLGFGLATQVRSTNTDTQLTAARPEDLVRILSDLDARQERLRREIAELEASKRQFESGAQGREAALAEAKRRAEVLGILAGTLPAEGPGLEITFADRNERIKAESVLDAVEELRGAGAEAMQITGANGAAVRIVASSYFADSGDGISVDGSQLSGPYVILVIGDAQTMQTALNIPGGVVDAVRQRGGNVTMRQPEIVRVTALHVGTALRYAQPVS